MSGTRRRGLVVQRRDLHLLQELELMRIIDREGVKVVAGFSSTTASNIRLLALTRAGLLRKFFVGSVAHGRKAVYTLSSKGRELVSAKLGGIRRPSNRLVVGDAFVEHQQRINDIYITVKYRPSPFANLLRWRTFGQPISETIKLMPDAYFEFATGEAAFPTFLEVDLGSEALSVWQQKTQSYIQLAISGEFQRLFRQPQFRVLVVASAEKRLDNIRATAAKFTGKIFWFTTFESINRDGIWSPIWLRANGSERRSLI